MRWRGTRWQPPWRRNKVPHERATVSVTPQEGTDALLIRLVDEHRFASKVFVSVEQAEALVTALIDALKPAPIGPFGRVRDIYDIDGVKRQVLITARGIFPVDDEEGMRWL